MLKVTNNVKVKKVKYTARDIQNYSTTVILPMVQELYDRLKLDVISVQMKTKVK
jgi:hypothetical protein